MIQDDLKLFSEIAHDLIEAEKEEPVVKPILAENLYNHLDLELGDYGSPQDEFQESLKQLVLHTPRTTTNKFFNQLFGGRNGKAVLGDLLAVMLNNSMYTYKVAGPMVGAEKVVLRKICDLIGYGEHADGTFAPGGSMSNYMAMLMARDVIDPDARFRGSKADLIVYTSEEAHYSIPKNAAFMGLGREQVRYVKSDDRGVIIPEDLEKSDQIRYIERSKAIFCKCYSGNNRDGSLRSYRGNGQHL